ncbi:MAG: hypothetical protein ACP5NV_05230 [Candidatus Woesearchaeota archaeon]
MRKSLIYSLIVLMPFIFTRDNSPDYSKSKITNSLSTNSDLLNLRSKYNNSSWEKHINKKILDMERNIVQEKVDILGTPNIDMAEAYFDSYLKAQDNYILFMNTNEFKYASRFLSFGRVAYETSPSSVYTPILLERMINVTAKLDSMAEKNNSLDNVVE